MAKRKQQNYIKGTATHCRTEGDYMSTLLDSVTLDDWEEVVSSALSAAKRGDAQARAWLAQYLVGKPAGKAPTPLTVVVQQLNGDNPLINKLAETLFDKYNYPDLHKDDALEDQIKALIAAELAKKIPVIKTVTSPQPEMLTADLESNQSS